MRKMLSPRAIFSVIALAIKTNVILPRTPPCSFFVFLVAWGLYSVRISLPGSEIRLSDTVPLCCLERQLKYTISRRE